MAFSCSWRARSIEMSSWPVLDAYGPVPSGVGMGCLLADGDIREADGGGPTAQMEVPAPMRRVRHGDGGSRGDTGSGSGDLGRGDVDTQGRGAVIDDVQLEVAGLAQHNVVTAQPRLVVTGVVEGPIVCRGDEGAGPAVLGCCRVDADGEREAEPVGRGAVDGAGPALQRALVCRAGVGVAPGVRCGERSAVTGDGAGEVAVVVDALPEWVGSQHGRASG